jgi:predicted flap endonuclease-1-like 5' DNA nuclease
MRSDYALYIVALIFFIITVTSFALVNAEFERNLSTITTAVLGLLFLALGYTLRPRMRTSSIETAVPQPLAVPQSPLVIEVPKQEEVIRAETVAQIPVAPSSVMSLTAVKGIKEKRAEQLKNLGINSVEDLANASAADLASKLKIASYFTEKWIQSAKELLSNPSK